MDWGRRGAFISGIHVSMERMPRIVLLLSHSRMSLHGGVFHCGPEKKCIYFVTSTLTFSDWDVDTSVRDSDKSMV